MKTFKSIKYWIFDLDNTLYSGKTRVFEQVSKRMTKYVSNKLNIDLKLRPQNLSVKKYIEICKIYEDLNI